MNVLRTVCFDYNRQMPAKICLTKPKDRFCNTYLCKAYDEIGREYIYVLAGGDSKLLNCNSNIRIFNFKKSSQMLLSVENTSTYITVFSHYYIPGKECLNKVKLKYPELFI